MMFEKQRKLNYHRILNNYQLSTMTEIKDREKLAGIAPAFVEYIREKGYRDFPAIL